MKFLIATVCFSSTFAMAEDMTSRDFFSKKKTIESNYHMALKHCNTLELNAKEVCLAEADAMKDIDNSELLADYKPTVNSRHHAMIVRAESNYKIALAKCNMDFVLDKIECQNTAMAQKEKEVDHANSFWNRFNL